MKLRIFAVALLIVAASLDAAVTYRFSSISEGSYARHDEANVIVDGKHWRIDYDPTPDRVTVLDTIIGTDDGLVAINHPLHTWYRLSSAKQLAIDPSLFSFGYGATLNNVSKLKIESHPPESDPNKPGGSTTRIVFSYRIETTVSSEKVRGDVWGEIRLWTTEAAETQELPWKPLELQTGLEPVDQALHAEFARIRGMVWRCEVEVSRRLDGGAVLKQVTRRTMTAPVRAASNADLFVVPRNFVYQEPIIGSPGATR